MSNITVSFTTSMYNAHLLQALYDILDQDSPGKSLDDMSPFTTSIYIGLLDELLLSMPTIIDLMINVYGEIDNVESLNPPIMREVYKLAVARFD